MDFLGFSLPFSDFSSACADPWGKKIFSPPRARDRARGRAPLGRAERLAAVTLLGSTIYIVLNESIANWQAVWFAAMLVVLAVTLFRLRDVQSI